MNAREDRPVSWLSRIMVVMLVLGGGVLAAIPFRRPAPAVIEAPRRLSSDSVRLVFRNQDITLQMNPRVEASPAELPPAELPPVVLHTEQLSAQPPELPAQYPLLDPNSTAPRAVVPNLAGRVHEPVHLSPPKPRQHVLVDGDSLSRLAERYLGNANRAGEILQLNADILVDPETLPIGKTIVIPPRQTSP